MQLRNYQLNILKEIEKKKHVKKLCVQLATGGGKTISFTELAKQRNAKI